MELLWMSLHYELRYRERKKADSFDFYLPGDPHHGVL